jgi:hypothetical protein
MQSIREVISLSFPVPVTAFLVMQLLVTLLPVTSFTVTIPHTIPHKYDLDGADI